MTRHRSTMEGPTKSKLDLIDASRKALEKWQQFLAGLREDEIMAAPPDGRWSIGEVVSHMAAWQQVSVARLEAALRGADPILPDWLGGADPFYADEHADEFNARIRQAHRDEPWSQRHRQWHDGFARFLELAEAVPEGTLFEAGRYAWLRGDPLAAVVEGSAEHHEEHLEKVRARSGTPGNAG